MPKTEVCYCMAGLVDPDTDQVVEMMYVKLLPRQLQRLKEIDGLLPRSVSFDMTRDAKFCERLRDGFRNEACARLKVKSVKRKAVLYLESTTDAVAQMSRQIIERRECGRRIEFSVVNLTNARFRIEL